MSGFFKTLLGIERGVQASPLPIQTPDITKTQLAIGLQFVASVAVGATVLTPAEGQVLIGASSLIGTGVAIADAIIRHGRTNAIAAKIFAGVGDGGGHMGATAPIGEPLPPAPTTENWPDAPVTVTLASTTAPDAAQQPPNPTPPPAPAVPPEHIEEARKQAEAAREAAQAAYDRLQALRDAATAQQPQ